MIGVVDIEAAAVYWCNTSDEAGDVKRMLTLVGRGYKEITIKSYGG